MESGTCPTTQKKTKCAIVHGLLLSLGLLMLIRKIYKVYGYFYGGLECFAYVAIFLIFEGCLDSNPERLS
jgi:hypothetical protein